MDGSVKQRHREYVVTLDDDHDNEAQHFIQPENLRRFRRKPRGVWTRLWDAKWQVMCAVLGVALVVVLWPHGGSEARGSGLASTSVSTSTSMPKGLL